MSKHKILCHIWHLTLEHKMKQIEITSLLQWFCTSLYVDSDVCEFVWEGIQMKQVFIHWRSVCEGALEHVGQKSL